MTINKNAAGYKFQSPEHSHTHEFLLPCIRSELDHFFGSRLFSERRLFEIGCGNGSMANALTKIGYDVKGIDPSRSGIEQAKLHYPGIQLEEGSVYDELPDKFGRFPVVVSLEVVEHLYSPRIFAERVFGLLEPGGLALVSTPYHGYLKNLALAVTGRMDAHFNPLWDDGHIKFWSISTLSRLFADEGLVIEKIHRVGRVPVLAKSMVAVLRKPV